MVYFESRKSKGAQNVKILKNRKKGIDKGRKIW